MEDVVALVGVAINGRIGMEFNPASTRAKVVEILQTEALSFFSPTSTGIPVVDTPPISIDFIP